MSIPLRIIPIMSSSDHDRPANRLRAADVEPVLQQLDTAARAKLPIIPALRALAEETPSGRTRRVLRRLVERLEQGESLSDALATTDLRVSPVLRMLSQRGVQLGRLDALLHWTVEQTRRSNELRRQLWASIAYPAVLLGTAMSVTGFIMFTIVPQFAKIFSDFGTELPGITQVVVNVARFGQDYGILCLAGLPVFSAIVGWLFAWRGHWMVTQRWSGAIPLIGPLFRLAALTEFCHLLAVFVESELPLTEGVLVAGESSEDDWLRQTSIQLATDITRGVGADMAALTCGFPATLAHVLRETSSPQTLADALRGLGDVYAARTVVGSRLSSSIIEPFVMVFTVVGLGTIVIALFMPLIKLLNDLS